MSTAEDDEQDGRAAHNPNRVGMYLDVLLRIIGDLDRHPRLREIFGMPVVANLVIVADDNDLRLEESGRVNMTPEQANEFVEILDEVIRANAV